MDWRRLLFSFRGRINRAKFWLATLVYVVAGIIIALIGFALIGSMGDYAFIVDIILNIPIIVSSIAVGLKRAHDREHSVWWLLVFLIIPGAVLEGLSFALATGAIEPSANLTFLKLVAVVVGLWGFIELGCLRGTSGPNRFGPDPLTS